jgi:CheY-like chemotaxis protein
MENNIMDTIEKKERKVLVVEDSRSDRLRFRSILEMIGTDFCFAWNAKEQEVPDIDEILKLIEKINPTVLLLDLAWTTEDDRILQKLLFLDIDEIEGLKKLIEAGNYNSNEKNWISGFRLLEKIKKEKAKDHIQRLKIIVTTQYIPAVAFGLRKYLLKEFHSYFFINVIHKWQDEEKLMSMI